MWLTGITFRLFSSFLNRTGVGSKFWLSSLVRILWLKPERAALNKQSEQREASVPPNHPIIFRILTAWQTLSNSIVCEPVWNGGKEKKTKGKQRHRTWRVEEDAVTSCPTCCRKGLYWVFCFHLRQNTVRIIWQMCVCTWKFVCLSVWLGKKWGEYLCVHTCYKALSFTYRALHS